MFQDNLDSVISQVSVGDQAPKDGLDAENDDYLKYGTVSLTPPCSMRLGGGHLLLSGSARNGKKA